MSLVEKLFGTLLKCADVIRERHEISMLMLGRRCAGNTAFFKRIQSGNEMWIRTADEALAWFSHHWPKDVKWPGFYRPDDKFTAKVMKSLPPERLLSPPTKTIASIPPTKKRTSNRQPNTLPG